MLGHGGGRGQEEGWRQGQGVGVTIPVPPPKFVATVGAPFVDESLLGYVGRALSVTAVRQVSTMLKLAGAAKPNAAAIPTTLVDAGEIARIATLFGCEPADIASRTYAISEIEHSGSEVAVINKDGTPSHNTARDGIPRHVIDHMVQKKFIKEGYEANIPLVPPGIIEQAEILDGKNREDSLLRAFERFMMSLVLRKR
jgi:hypothetical protein